MKIVGVWGMVILDTDDITEISTIDLGPFTRGQTKRFPSSGNYYIDNTGDYPIFIAYQVDDLPSGATMSLWARRQGDPEWVLTPENTLWTHSGGQIRSIGTGDQLEWYFEISVSATAAFAEATPIMTWKGYEFSTDVPVDDDYL